MRPKKILLVEDDAALTKVYVERLMLEGYDVKHVVNGEQALSVAMAYRPDLIVLDVMMPKIDGFDVLDILRNTPETMNDKIMMLTALGDPKDRQRAEQLGVDEYVVKSQMVIDDVIRRISHILAD